MPDKPSDRKSIPVLEPNFEKHEIEVQPWLQEIWQDANRSSVLLRVERGSAKSSGSGFFVDREGYIATANHVVKNASSINIVTFDGRTLPADLVASSPADDIAVLQLRSKRTPDTCRAMPIGESEKLSSGQLLVNIGHPNGARDTYASVGHVDGSRRELECSVPELPGSSGGSVLDANGSAVAVVLGVRYAKGGEKAHRGMWVSAPPPGDQPGSYADRTSFCAPAESLSLLLSRTDPKFTVTRHATGWAGEHLEWLSESPLHIGADVAVIGATGYGGARLLNRHRAFAIPTGIAAGVMMGVDGYQRFYSPPHSAIQHNLALSADTVALAGSLLRTKYGRLATAVIGLGAAARLGSEFYPSGVQLHIRERK